MSFLTNNYGIGKQLPKVLTFDYNICEYQYNKLLCSTAIIIWLVGLNAQTMMGE